MLIVLTDSGQCAGGTAVTGLVWCGGLRGCGEEVVAVQFRLGQ